MARRKKSIHLTSILTLVIIFSFAYFFNLIPFQNQTQSIQPDSTQVFFSPEDNCDLKVIQLIDSANESIDIAVYSFTLDSIGDAVIRAKKRGVKVRVVTEKQQVSQYSEYWKLLNEGIEVFNDSNSAFMHDKFAVIDGKIVLTGSYNWSRQATERNNENLIIIYSEEIASEYEKEFEKIFEEAKASV